MVAEPGNVAHVFAKDVGRVPGKPSGLRPEGCCHSKKQDLLLADGSEVGVRLHGECQGICSCWLFGTDLPAACGLQLFALLQVRSLGPSVAEGSHHERHAVDGRPIGNRRYRRARDRVFRLPYVGIRPRQIG